MFKEKRFVFQHKPPTSSDISRSESEVAGLSTTKYMPSLDESRYILDSRIDGAATVAQLPEDIAEHMEGIVEGGEINTPLKPEDHLFKFAKALRRTKFFSAAGGGVKGRTTTALNSNLDKFIAKVDTSAGTPTFTPAEKTFVLWMKKMYLATAYYKVRYDAISGDTRGQLKSTKETIGKKLLKTPGDLIELFSTRPLYQQIAIAGAVIAPILFFMTRKPRKGADGKDQANIWSDIGSLLKKGLALGAVGIGGYFAADIGWEHFTGKKLGDSLERANNTTDVQSYVEYFGVTEANSEEVVEATNDTMLHNKYYAQKPFQVLWNEYKLAKTKPISQQLINARSDVLPNRENVTPDENQEFNKLVFTGMKYVDAKLNSLKAELVAPTTDPVRKASLQELFDGIEKRGLSASDTLLRLIAYEKSDTKVFHTILGKWVDTATTTDRDNADVLDGLDHLHNRFERPEELKLVKKLWQDPNFMLAPQGSKNSAPIINEAWLKSKFGNSYEDLETMMASQDGALLHTALLNSQPIENAAGEKFLAADVAIDEDSDTADVIISKVYKALLAKYSIDPTKVKFRLEIMVGAKLEGGKYGLLVKAIPINKYYKPI